MADTKISGLSSAGALGGTEEVPIVQSSSTVKTTVQDIANLASSSNLGNADLTSTAATRKFTLAGSASTDNLTIERGDGTDIVQFKGNLQVLWGGVSFKQGSTGNYDWTLGGDLSSDSLTIQNASGTDIAEFRGDQATQLSGIVGIGAAPNTNQPLYAYSNTHSRTAYFLNQTANGAAFYALASINNNSFALKAFATGAGGTGVRYAADLDASGGSTNYALYVRGGDIWLGDTTNGHKIGTATTQKFAFWGSTPVVQQNTTGTTTGFTAGVGTGVNDDSTFTGNTGSTAYTIGDLVNILKTIGLIAS